MTKCGVKVALLALGILGALGSQGATARKDVVCTTCRDTGKVSVPCEVCSGSKYVWVCYEREERKRVVRPNAKDTGYCGYGNVYKPYHENCKKSRKRINCPNCANASKTFSSGKVISPCPDCDGNGTLLTTYYVILDARTVKNRRPLLLKQLETAPFKDSKLLVCRRMTPDDLADFRIGNVNCRAFESLEAVTAFVRDGEAAQAGAKWYFAVRDRNQVTLADKRVALEDLARGNVPAVPSKNVLKRRFTDEELEDFRALNPDSVTFRDLDEFKKFIRSVKTAEPPKSVPVVVRLGGAEDSPDQAAVETRELPAIPQVADGPAPEVADGAEWEEDDPQAPGYRPRPAAVGRPGRVLVRRRYVDEDGNVIDESVGVQREYTPEEIEKIAEAEMRYDEQMRERKFGGRSEGKGRREPAGSEARPGEDAAEAE